MPEQPRQEDIDELMKVLAGSASASPARPEPASRAPAEAPAPPTAAPPPPPPARTVEAGMDFLADVDVQVRVELGHAKLNVKDVLKLNPGAVVGLDSLIGDPVNVFVNDRLVARGEVLVVRDNFAVRITEVVPPSKAGE